MQQKIYKQEVESKGMKSHWEMQKIIFDTETSQRKQKKSKKEEKIQIF